MSAQSVPEALTDRFVALLCELMDAVATASDTYGTSFERRQLEKFLLASGLFAGREDADKPCARWTVPELHDEPYAGGFPTAQQYADMAANARECAPGPDMPEIVVLCGSTRFMEAFQEANLRLTLQGKIVLSVGCNTKSDDQLVAEGLSIDKAALDELHKRKIDLADRVLVLNVGGYIGDSTRSEIAYAEALGKPVDWLEVPPCQS